MAILAVVFHVPALQAQDGNRDASVPGTIAGAILGGGVGFVGGAFAGGAIDVALTPSCQDLCAIDGIVLGAMIGEIVLLPLGAHVGNRGRGSLLADYGVSIAIGTAGAVSGVAVESGVLLGIAGAVQVAAVVFTEVMTSPRLTVSPLVRRGSQGGTDIGLQMTF